MDAFDLSTLSHIVPSLQVRSLWLSNDARRQLGAGQEEIVQEVGANFSCAHFNYFSSSTWFVHYLLSTIQPSGCAFQFCERGCGECLKDVAKMKTLYKELPYLAALSNMFSSQWQLNCHLKSHIVHPMPWMLPILMHISSTFGIDNINLKLMKLNEKVSNVAKHM